MTALADNRVGLTVIEYEKDLTKPAIHAGGFRQVCDYMAGLLNLGAPMLQIRGVLSDTVRWFAYEVQTLQPGVLPGAISFDDLTLRCTASIDCSAADLTAARQLHQFLDQQLGRDGGQALSARSLRTMLGVEGTMGEGFVDDACAVVDAAFAANPDYGSMMSRLWANFVTFIGTEHVGVFNQRAYAIELYLLTVAKLIAANALGKASLVSTRPQLQAILDGQHFANQGLTNLVEHDYFGWLTQPPHVGPLLQLAERLQQALKPFDFSYLVPQDLFGPLICQMATRTQRVLLGQEPTPGWLVKLVVDAVQSRLPADADPRYVDPCCGSGAFVVEVVLRRASAPGFADLSREAQGKALTEVMHGFDIDPLAVVFAKVNWLVAAKPFLSFDGAHLTSIPIYHADSLFAMTPLTSRVAGLGDNFNLHLDNHPITLPAFLADPSYQALFDEFTERLYAFAQVCAKNGHAPADTDVSNVLDNALITSGTVFDLEQTTAAEAFGLAFAAALATLERSGRNGLWLHMLKNGYRPAMVRGKFNAVVTNFPWLALSKLVDNPYADTLQRLTTAWNLQPSPSSQIHLELATLFFLHAATHYLGDDGFMAAVLPSSVVQGEHHVPFRARRFALPPSNLALHFCEVWDVDAEAFTTNRAAVVVAQKGGTPVALVGAEASRTRRVPHPLYLSTLNQRNAWTRAALNAGAGYTHYAASQGADAMPRTIWFHDIANHIGPGGRPMARVEPIQVAVSPNGYLLAQPKVASNFRATARVLPEKWVFHVLTSAHLVQFNLNAPAAAVLPFERRSTMSRQVTPASDAAIALNRSAQAHFSDVFDALDVAWHKQAPFDSASVFLKKLNIRNKLSEQRFAPNERLVVYGASGTHPCAAVFCIDAPLADTLIIDQTLYWVTVQDADEADYMVGMINSDTLARTVFPFQPTGMLGARHLHTLPVQVLEPWNAASQAHQDVLTTTRSLTWELTAAGATPSQLKSALGIPKAKVSGRRQVVRKALESLPSFAAYQAACLAVLPS